MKFFVGVRYRTLLFLIGSLLTLAACRTTENAVPKSITDQIMADEQFSFLQIMIQQADAGDARSLPVGVYSGGSEPGGNGRPAIRLSEQNQ